MKTRYKILILNVVLSILYFFTFYFVYEFTGNTDESIWDSIVRGLSFWFMLIFYYNWIHVIWLGFIVLGIIKKKRELIYGGIFSIILSILFLIMIYVS